MAVTELISSLVLCGLLFLPNPLGLSMLLLPPHVWKNGASVMSHSEEDGVIRIARGAFSLQSYSKELTGMGPVSAWKAIPSLAQAWRLPGEEPDS